MDVSALALPFGNTQIGPDRTESPGSIIPGPEGVIVLVDPVSTGACLAKELADRGNRLVRVWSDTCPDVVKNHTKKGTEVTYAAPDIQVVAGDFDAAAAALVKLGLPIKELMVGCESGVLCADQLAHKLGVRNNGIALSGCRRNKFAQIEAVRAAGLDAPLQTLARTAEDVDQWLANGSHPTPFKAVIKPVEGAGSDGVSICDSPEEVRRCFRDLEGTKNVLGLVNYEVLLQEFLRGDEYVVDTVSANGVAKVVALWKYDKRESNGAPVVYFGMRLLQLDQEPMLAKMVEYVQGVLGAIGIEWGAAHTEVKLEERGPVLIEVNCRLHGGEGIWLPISQACLGHTQVTAMADAYLNPSGFDALAPSPSRLLKHGAWVTIRSPASGAITRIHAARIEQIRNLKSYQDEYIPFAVGSVVAMTVDACTVHGCFNLVHADPAQLEADYEAAQELVEAGLFEIGNEAAAVPAPAAEAVDVQ